MYPVLSFYTLQFQSTLLHNINYNLYFKSIKFQVLPRLVWILDIKVKNLFLVDFKESDFFYHIYDCHTLL